LPEYPDVVHVTGLPLGERALIFNQMKKLLFLFLFLISFFSCEKEEATCWECSTITIGETIWPATNYILERDYWSESIIICDHTEKEIRDFEDKKTYTSDTIYFVRNFLTYGKVYKSTCYCIK
jgi:hypothetical protein